MANTTGVTKAKRSIKCKWCGKTIMFCVLYKIKHQWLYDLKLQGYCSLDCKLFYENPQAYENVSGLLNRRI